MLPALTIAEVAAPGSPFILQGRPFLESVELASRYGFRGVEIQLRAPEDLDEKAFLSCCERCDVKLVSIATGLALAEGLSLSSQVEAKRLRTIERVFGQIDLAADCGQDCGVMIGLLIGRRCESPDSESFYSALGDSLLRIADYAAKRGVKVNLEPVNHHDSDALNTWEETLAFLDRFDCAYIRIGLDLYHMRLEEKDIIKTIRRYGNRIGCVQLMDDNRMAPGCGNFKFEKIIAAVRESGYDGAAIMECLPGDDPVETLSMAADWYALNLKN